MSIIWTAAALEMRDKILESTQASISSRAAAIANEAGRDRISPEDVYLAWSEMD